MRNHTAQLHSFILSIVGPLQVVFQNLGRANDDVIFPYDLGKGDFELGVSSDSLHLIRVLQKGQELCGVVLLHERDLRSARTHAKAKGGRLHCFYNHTDPDDLKGCFAFCHVKTHHS